MDSTQSLSAQFPQRVDAGSDGSETAMARLYHGPGELRNTDGTRHLRAETIDSWKPNERGVDLILGARAYVNRFVQTHETQLFQFTEAQRGQTLLARVEYYAENVVRIRIGREDISDPYEEIEPDSRMLHVPEDPNISVAVTERSKDESSSVILIDHPESSVKIEIDRDPFVVRVVDREGRERFAQKRRDLFTSDVWDTGYLESPDGATVAFSEAVSLRGRERIVGLGERFDGVLRNGRPVDFRNKDAIGTSSQRSYINVPFYLSSAGYGLFLNSSANPEWDMGVSDHSALQFCVQDDRIDYFIVYGPDPAAILSRYTSLTGRAPVPPTWSFGLWLSRNSYTSWDVVDEVVQDATDRGLPFDVIHLDTAWFREDWNCDLRFSEDRFPAPRDHMESLRKMGIRTSLWQYNFIPRRDDNQNYVEARSNGYLVTDADGNEFSYPDESVGSWLDDQIIDFTNPQAAEWYGQQVEQLVRDGAAAIKVDFGEGIPDGGVYARLRGDRLHNLYSLLYTKVIADATFRASREWIVWARCGTAGGQRYPVHWGGDSQCSWAGLRGTLKAALSIGLSGFAYFSHDIGGFIGRPAPELYIRWAQFGLLSSHSRTHGAGDQNSREPWTFGDEASGIFLEFARLRYSLLPYLNRCAEEARDSGLPVVRSLLIEFPEDPQCWTIEDQYMLGGSLLVVPILAPLSTEAVREFYLPAGRWYDFWSKECIESRGQWYSSNVSLERIPMYVRAGAIIPYTTPRDRTGDTILPISHVEGYVSPDDAQSSTLEIAYDGYEAVWKLKGEQLSAFGDGDQADRVVFGRVTRR